MSTQGVPPPAITQQPSATPQMLVERKKDDKGRPTWTDMEAVQSDYTRCVEYLGKYADIIVVNVSSPNTPGLRTLQNVEPLTRLLSSVVQAVNKVDRKTKPAIMVKVSPDEDSEEQVSGICEAVWDSGVDGVIVGNTTKKRPDPLPKGYLLPEKDASALLEQGGYSGPQMFERTLSLVRRYRKNLDDGPKQLPPPKSPDQSAGDASDSSVLDKVNATEKLSETVEATKASLPDATTELPSASSPLSTNVDDISESAPLLAVQSQTGNAAPAPVGPRKVIFATGGITNGRQAREILDAGASVAQVYTAIIYGGVGTISKIKKEMRDTTDTEK